MKNVELLLANEDALLLWDSGSLDMEQYKLKQYDIRKSHILSNTTSEKAKPEGC